MSEMENCPFCGSTASIHGYDEWDDHTFETDRDVYVAWMECDCCGATRGREIISLGGERGDIHSPDSNYSKAKEKCEKLAIAAWNTRQPRFSETEREALSVALYCTVCELDCFECEINPSVCPRIISIEIDKEEDWYNKKQSAIATVRAMLSGKGGEE